MKAPSYKKEKEIDYSNVRTVFDKNKLKVRENQLKDLKASSSEIKVFSIKQEIGYSNVRTVFDKNKLKERENQLKDLKANSSKIKVFSIKQEIDYSNVQTCEPFLIKTNSR